MVSEDDYEIWILPQELQSVDIKLQSFWPNWCSAKEECNTSCCDVPCILFSTVSGHACHSTLQSSVGTVLWPYSVNFSLTDFKVQKKKKETSAEIMHYNSTVNVYACLLRNSCGFSQKYDQANQDIAKWQTFIALRKA